MILTSASGRTNKDPKARVRHGEDGLKVQNLGAS